MSNKKSDKMAKFGEETTASPEPGRNGNSLCKQKIQTFAGVFLKVSWDYYLDMVNPLPLSTNLRREEMC